MRFSRRGKIRFISFLTAAFFILLVRNIILMRENNRANLLLESGYLRAVEDLSTAADNLSLTLSKELCSASPEMQSKLAAELLSEAETAKAALLQLPVAQLELSGTYKFLSQVGNYAVYLADKSANGEKITDEEYKTLKALSDYARDLCNDMWTVERMINSGALSPKEVISSLDASAPNGGEISVADGFNNFEDGFESYPTLIYDGPFSDHLMEREPLMTKHAQEVSQGYAAAKACKALGVTEDKLTKTEGAQGNMPSYEFSCAGAAVSVTKKGGYICYMLKPRNPETAKIDSSEAIRQADAYLKHLGINSCAITYYEILGNVATINYAYLDGDVLCYTDLIKIKVAMDNGEVLGFDARGFLTNHRSRDFKTPGLSKEQAAEKVSPLLQIKGVKLTNIPLDSKSEAYCYEFRCKTDDGRTVLVYIDCQTGEEKQILLLFESESGVLAQ